MDRSPLVVGIAGGTGSGKTTLANKLKAAIAEDALILSHDFYYRANTEIPFEERAKRNYDHPDAFDTDQMIVKQEHKSIPDIPARSILSMWSPRR